MVLPDRFFAYSKYNESIKSLAMTTIIPIRVDYDHWFDTYCPIPNPFEKEAAHNGTMFETYGPELQHVQSANVSHVWTLVAGDREELVVSGYRHVNRIGYFITENPWTVDMDVDTA